MSGLDSVLPPEILTEIFVFCTTSPLAPLTLACVSTWWREVVQSSPRVWQYIYLDDRSSLASSRAQVALWMRMSYPLPFDVILDVSQSPDLVLPLLSPLFPFMNRWRQLTMTGMRDESIALSGSLANGVDPLVVTIQDPDLIAAKGSLRQTFTGMAPQWLAMNIWLVELPKPVSLFAPMHFTAIVILEHSLSIHTQPRSILEFLSACTQLVAFSFTAGWHHPDEPSDEPLPVVHLPALQRLHLRSTCATRSLLSYIDAPALTELFLAQLNVDFVLPLTTPEEEGDSDDEAGDFSRSPCSDRATGMGLRRLLLRSNPPLRVLQMDWSDMRTKDFRFVFDRLGTLERFFISASDMSDRVIELLRPDSQRRLRLPMLRLLELISCNELSGDTLLDVFSTRVALTDNREEWEGNTLSELMIDCEGFSHDHALLLRKDLGSRLKTSRESN